MPRLPVVATSRVHRVALLVARAVIAGVLAYAAVQKLADPRAFAESIANYHAVPDVIARGLAAMLPVLELVVAAALVAGIHVRGAAVVASAMFLVFAAAMIQAILRGINIDCGCFGSGLSAQITWWTVLRNIGFFSFTFFIAASETSTS